MSRARNALELARSGLEDGLKNTELKKDAPHPKAVPGRVESSDVFKCFFAYSSGVMFSRAEWGMK